MKFKSKLEGKPTNPFIKAELLGRKEYAQYREMYSPNVKITDDDDLYGCYDLVVRDPLSNHVELVEIKRRDVGVRTYTTIFLCQQKVDKLLSLLTKLIKNDPTTSYLIKAAFIFNDGWVGEISLGDIVQYATTSSREINKTTAEDQGKTIRHLYEIPTNKLTLKPTTVKVN